MSEEQIAFQITYASVDAGGEADPTDRAARILRAQRVLAAMREFDGMETTVLVPVTDAGVVVALADDGRLRFDLTTQQLRELFADDGLTLHLGFDDDAIEEVDVELDEQFGEAFEMLDDAATSPEELGGFGMPADQDGDVDFAPEPVQVAEFSHRGPWGARATAQILGTEVDYLEADQWSMYRYRTDRPHMAISGGRADLPIIEANVPQHGEAWVEVTAPGGHSGYFWVNAERLTQPVLEIESIAVAESAELYRRMLIEADGVRDELIGLGMGAALDVEQAVLACTPEALGGLIGETARLRAFVAAFGVPMPLIEAGLGEQGKGRQFTPRGWGLTFVDFMLGGLTETTPLTRRDRPIARFSRFLRKRPLLGASLSTAELAAGAALSRGRSRIGRGLGVLLIIDAAADLVLWAVRKRRRR